MSPLKFIIASTREDLSPHTTLGFARKDPEILTVEQTVFHHRTALQFPYVRVISTVQETQYYSDYPEEVGFVDILNVEMKI